MAALKTSIVDTAGRTHQVVLFGSGTIGHAIAASLATRSADRVYFPVPWTNADERGKALVRIGNSLRSSAPHRVCVVWAAGTAGFGSTEAETRAELSAFEDVMKAFVALRERAGAQTRCEFHLVSSAGGVSEGRVVRRATLPTPSRPYGRLKSAEEALVAEAVGPGGLIYRPSSVYGVPRPSARPGLIGTLLSNGVARRPTRVVGTLDTRRDYVAARDVGSFIANRVITGVAPEQTEPVMLVSGSALPLSRVIETVQRVLRTTLLFEIVPAWNAEDIAFPPSVRAAGFAPMDLLTGVSWVYHHMFRSDWS